MKKSIHFIGNCAIILIATVFIFTSCSSDSPNRSFKSKEARLNLLSIEISGRENLKINLDIKGLRPKSKSVSFKIHAVSTSENQSFKDMSWQTPNIDSTLTLFLKFIADLPYNAPQNANYKYESGQFKLQESYPGNQLDTSKIRLQLTKQIKSRGIKLDLDQQKLYILPKYESNSEEVRAAKQALDRCLKSSITLIAENESFTLTKTIFGPWLSLDSTLQVKVDKFLMQLYLQKVALKIEPSLTEILEQFDITDTTQALDEIKFPRMNISKEIEDVSALIIKGSNSSKQIIFSTRGLPNGIKLGYKDFVEVSLAEQKLWLFKDGNLIIETDIVTGNEKLGRTTPVGNYKILYKQKNKTLRGPGYASFVSYWMPFYNGYGLHDANWRRTFGSNIYERGGSHGCVNLPPKIAPLVYQNVEIGMPVLIH